MGVTPKSRRQFDIFSRSAVLHVIARRLRWPVLALALLSLGVGVAAAQEESGHGAEAQAAPSFSELRSALSGDGLAQEQRFELITRAADRAPTVADALAVVRSHRGPLRGHLRAQSFALEGRILALREDLAGGARAYAQAARAAPDAEARAAYRLEQATLLLETGDLGTAREIAVDVVASGRSAQIQRRAGLLTARADAAAGRLEAAFDQASRLSEAAHAPTVLPETLLFLHRVSRRLGRDEDAARAGRLLEELYPGSPEALMLAGEGVAGRPRPSALLGFTAAPPDSGRNAEPTSDGANPSGAGEPQSAGDGSAGERPYGVQVGSFRSMDNARDMRVRLVDLGFGAEIVDSDDGAFHRVVIPVGADTEPQRLLLSLKEEGVEGFLVFDE